MVTKDRSTPPLTDLLNRLRDARYAILGDAEAFTEGARTLEHIGQLRAGSVKLGMGDYWEKLEELLTPLTPEQLDKARRLYWVVKDTRNDAVHQGAWARHVAQHLIELLLLFEEALTLTLMEKPDITVADMMITRPVIAEPWHLVAHVRTLMLANSFSYLPYLVEVDGQKRWHLLSDSAVLAWLLPAKSNGKKRELLGVSVEQAVSNSLRLDPAQEKLPTTKVDEVAALLAKRTEPVLIVEDGRLLGLITAFDIM